MVTAGEILPSIAPYFTGFMDVAWIYIQLGLWLGVIGYIVFIVYMFNIKLNIREFSKGGRLIVRTTRAKKIIDKRTGAPKLKMIGIFGFNGIIINEPPADCLVPYRSKLTNKLYDFVLKDGNYHPVSNFCLGRKHEVVDKKTGERTIVYSLEGSGLEVSRDYDSEQAIQNILIEKATTYRNRKPTEIVAGIAAVIVCVVVSGVIMYFAWKEFGNMAGAIASLREPLKQGIQGAAQSIVGPG